MQIIICAVVMSHLMIKNKQKQQRKHHNIIPIISKEDNDKTSIISNMIITTKHTINHANTSKLSNISDFIDEYRRIAQIYIDHMWTGLKWTVKNKQHTFNATYLLDHPRMWSTVELNKELNLNTFLSARALKCCITQVCGMIGSAVEKQRKRRFIANRRRSSHQKISRRLRKAIRAHKPVKPNVSDINPEINSICVDIQESDNSFDYFIQLRSLVNDKKNFKLNIPIKHHRHSRKWSTGDLKNSISLSKNNIDLRWEIKTTKKTIGKIVGADQGLKDVLTLSDEQVTPKTDCHGHSLESITDKLARRKKGSNGFGRAQDHRKNFVNWSINQLNLSDIREIRLEEIKNIRYKTPTSRKMSHWCNTLIRDKLVSSCEENEVRCTLQSSTYRSQRCNQCGLVRKANRKKKVYSCSNCGLELDADYNASLNHQHDLPDVSYALRKLNLNRTGFFWQSDGFYALTGEALAVPLPRK